MITEQMYSSSKVLSFFPRANAQDKRKTKNHFFQPSSKDNPNSA